MRLPRDRIKENESPFFSWSMERTDFSAKCKIKKGDEIMDHVENLREWMKNEGYDGIVLSRRDNFTWVSGGAKNAVCTNTEVGIGHYVIDAERIRLLADSSDAPRMGKEQNPLEGETILVPWYTSMDEYVSKMAEGKIFVSDTGIAGTKNVQEELVRLRMQLCPEEVPRYREIGQTCVKIVEGVCRDARPGQTEEEVASELKCRCLKEGVSPDCVLVGSDERILNYRHPVPTDKKIENSLMVVLGGEKYGLNISMTRIVYFGPVPEEIKERYEKTAYIFACMQCMMKEGMPYQEYFAKVQKLYEEAGYDGEWKLHHQGGPTGYACREFVVTPETGGEIHEGEAFAWNPTIQGTKCEETTYLTAEGIETFTRTKNWPCREVETPYGDYEVAGILEK